MLSASVRREQAYSPRHVIQIDRLFAVGYPRQVWRADGGAVGRKVVSGKTDREGAAGETGGGRLAMVGEAVEVGVAMVKAGGKVEVVGDTGSSHQAALELFGRRTWIE